MVPMPAIRPSAGVFPAQLVHVVALVLARHDERPVLLEGAGVHQLVDVLPRHPVAPRVALGHGLGPMLVEGQVVALVGLPQVRTDVVRIERLDRGGAWRP